MRPQVWLVQANGFDPRLASNIKLSLDALGIPWLAVAFDFTNLVLPPIDGFANDRPVVCAGPAFVRRLDHDDPHWEPGAFFAPERFRWSQFLRGWPDMMLSRDGVVRAVADILADPPKFPVFARPDKDSKAFDGGVFAPGGLFSALQGKPDDLSVVCASPIDIDAEYRAFVVGGEVIAASQYRQEGEPRFDGYVPGEVIDLALAADALWRPHDAYVVDIARSSGRWGIVEANCIMAARHYGADTDAIVSALCELASRD